MALRTAGTPDASGASSLPPFEDQEGDFDTAVVDSPRTESAPHEPATYDQVSANATAQTSAVAPAQTTAVAPAKKLEAAFSEFENVISLEDVGAMGVGAFPRVTVDVGGFSLDDKDIGKEIRIELMSWNNRFLVVPGAKDEESKKLVKISYDNKTLHDTGESVQAYLAHLKAEGYNEANSKQYVDLWGSLVYADGKEIPQEDRRIVQVQLSPQSVKQFKAFQVQVGWNQKRGAAKDASLLFLRAEKKELSGDRFGIVKFDLK